MPDAKPNAVTPPLPLRGPFTALGVFGGVLAASIMVPAGCSMRPSEADRLQSWLPLIMPAVLYALALVVRRRLAATRWTIPKAIAATLAAELVAGGLTGLAYAGKLEGVTAGPLAMVVLAPLDAGLLVALPLLVGIGVRLSTYRDGSLLARAAHGAMWLVVATACGPMALGLWLLHLGDRAAFDGDPVVWPLAALVAVLLVAAIVVIAVLRARASDLLVRVPAPSDLSRAQAPFDAHGRAEAFDLGTGADEWERTQRAASAYRGSSLTLARYRGDLELARRILRRHLHAATACLVVSLVTSTAAGALLQWLRHQPVHVRAPAAPFTWK